VTDELSDLGWAVELIDRALYGKPYPGGTRYRDLIVAALAEPLRRAARVEELDDALNKALSFTPTDDENASAFAEYEQQIAALTAENEGLRFDVAHAVLVTPAYEKGYEIGQASAAKHYSERIEELETENARLREIEERHNQSTGAGKC
jgi:hypothetical protein